MHSAVSSEWTWHRNWVRYRLTCTTWDKHSALHSVLSSPGRITKGAYLHKQGIGLCLLLIPHSTCPLQRIATKYRQWGADQSSYSYLSLTGSSACWTTKPGGQHALLQACKSCNNIHEIGRTKNMKPVLLQLPSVWSLVLDRLPYVFLLWWRDLVFFIENFVYGCSRYRFAFLTPQIHGSPHAEAWHCSHFYHTAQNQSQMHQRPHSELL